MATVAHDDVIAGVPTLTATVDEVVEDAAETFTYWATLGRPGRTRRVPVPAGPDLDGGRLRGRRGSDQRVRATPDTPPAGAHDPGVRPRHERDRGDPCRRSGSRSAVRSAARGRSTRPAAGTSVIVAGGLGMAPLRSAIYAAIRHRGSFRRVQLLVGARDPSQMLYRAELERWMSGGPEELEVHLTVDVADGAWPHREGVVTTLFPYADLDPKAATVFTCGPEIMMRSALRDLVLLGILTNGCG